MSLVTNIVLLMSCGEWDGHEPERLAGLDFLNAWLSDPERYHTKGTLHDVTEYGKNGKCMECYVAIGAFNHLDVEGFMAAFRAAPWDDPETVQLLIKEQENYDGFRMLRASDPTSESRNGLD